MKTIKKITIVTGIAVALLVGLVMGGVEVEAKVEKVSVREYNSRLGKYYDIVCNHQINRIKREIKSIVLKIKKSGKKYNIDNIPLYGNGVDYWKKLGLNAEFNEVPGGPRVSNGTFRAINDCPLASRSYVYYKLTGKKVNENLLNNWYNVK